MLPRARTAHLVVQDLPDETLIFDQCTGKAHCLNRTTALVWRHCDGRADLAGLNRLLEQELRTTCNPVVVQLALEQLASRHLLEGTVERDSPAQRRNRREALKRLAGAVALPFILTVTAPRANAAASAATGESGLACFPAGQPGLCPGGHPQLCCSGKCTTQGPLVCA